MLGALFVYGFVRPNQRLHPLTRCFRDNRNSLLRLLLFRWSTDYMVLLCSCVSVSFSLRLSLIQLAQHISQVDVTILAYHELSAPWGLDRRQNQYLQDVRWVSIEYLITQSNTSKNRRGDNTHPCLTPESTVNHRPSFPRCTTRHFPLL